MEQNRKNLDCRNYAPLDVAKGICHKRKQVVLADGEACEMFDELPKCKCCAKYIPGEDDYLGICAALSTKPMTYPDLIAVTCEWFTWKEA
jgi:4-hydroxyphenylacetate decarboxylase small subunit